MKSRAGTIVLAVCFGITVLSANPPARAEAPYQVAWARQLGTNGADYGDSVATDALGNIYLSGETNGNLVGTNAGSEDAFLVKYDMSGNLVWSRQIGTGGNEHGRSIAVDRSGNVYLSGSSDRSWGGPNIGGYDATLVKYDQSGNTLWARQIGTGTSDFSYCVAADSAGNVFMTGYTEGSLGGPIAGSSDAFLVKYDTVGNLLWSRQFGTWGYDYGYSVGIGASGNAFVTGYTGGSLGGPSAGGWDAFLTKYDGSGNLLWNRQIGTPSTDQSYSVAVDAVGNIYISGCTLGNLGGTRAGYDDAFLAKYDGAGNLIWVRQFGSSNGDGSQSVAVDAAGNVYTTGWTYGSLGGPIAGEDDAFLTKFDGAGNLLWSSQIGTSARDESWSVSLDASGSAYIAGRTYGALGGPSAGFLDAFLVKFIPEPATLSLLALGALPVLRRKRPSMEERRRAQRRTA